MRVNERRKRDYCKSCGELIVNKLKGSDYCIKCAKRRKDESNKKAMERFKRRSKLTNEDMRK